MLVVKPQLVIVAAVLTLLRQSAGGAGRWQRSAAGLAGLPGFGRRRSERRSAARLAHRVEEFAERGANLQHRLHLLLVVLGLELCHRVVCWCSDSAGAVSDPLLPAARPIKSNRHS